MVHMCANDCLLVKLGKLGSIFERQKWVKQMSLGGLITIVVMTLFVFSK